MIYRWFRLLRSPDQNGFGTRSPAEIILEARSAGGKLVAAPTTSVAVAEADVVSGRQALGVRRMQTGCSAIVYGTSPAAELVDSGAAVRHDRV